MIIDGQFWVGIGLLLLLTLSPGPSFALISAVAIGYGRWAAFVASLGVATGIVVYSAASALGLSLLLATSPEAFMVVKTAGAVYLAYLGVRSLLRSRVLGAATPVPPAGSALYTQGVLTNLLNPHVAIFYLTFLPQFIHPSDSVLAKSLLFGLSHGGIVISWFAIYAYGLTALTSRVRALQPWLLRASGVVLIVLALRLLLQSR